MPVAQRPGRSDQDGLRRPGHAHGDRRGPQGRQLHPADRLRGQGRGVHRSGAQHPGDDQRHAEPGQVRLTAGRVLHAVVEPGDLQAGRHRQLHGAHPLGVGQDDQRRRHRLLLRRPGPPVPLGQPQAGQGRRLQLQAAHPHDHAGRRRRRPVDAVDHPDGDRHRRRRPPDAHRHRQPDQRRRRPPAGHARTGARREHRAAGLNEPGPAPGPQHGHRQLPHPGDHHRPQRGPAGLLR